MSRVWIARLINLAWYQIIWFTAVLGGEDIIWLAFGMLAVHLCWVPDWKAQALLMLTAACLGGGLDALIASAGYYEFGADSSFPLPLWLIAIWMGFAGTLRHSLAGLVARPRLLTTLALIYAPIVYLSASRLGAVAFPMGNVDTAMLIATSWLLVLPTLLALNAYLRRQEFSEPALINTMEKP